MPLDTVPTYPGQYDANEANNYPDGSETRKEGDDHLRRLKASEKATWTNVTGAVTATHGQLNLTASLSETEEITQFPTGTKMVFYQNTAPTGWTVDATVDEHAVRLTQGTGPDGDPGAQEGGAIGGTNNFSTQFATLAEGATPGVGNHTLTAAQSGRTAHTHPSHRHRVLGDMTGAGGARTTLAVDTDGTGDTPVYIDLNETGFPQVEGTVTPASSAASAASGHSHTVDLRVKWAACIVATKD